MGIVALDELKAHYSNRRVLVTGSTGFKGSWLCKILSRAGAEVVGFSLEPPTEPSLFEIAGIGEIIDQRMGDIRDYDELSQVFDQFKPQTVFHLAAQPLVLDSYAHPRYTYEVNVMGAVNVLECARVCESVTSIVNVTTDKVYENIENPNHGYREEEKLDGFDPYSNSKSCSELVTHAYSHSFFGSDSKGSAAGRCAVSTARAGNVVGGGDFSANRIVPDCVRAALAGKELVIRNKHSIRPYQHVLEPILAYLIIAAAQDEDRSKAGWYNIGPDQQDCVTTGQIVDLFSSFWGDGFNWRAENADGLHEAGCLVLDTSKVRNTFGWRPIWDVREAMRRTVEWVCAWQQGLAAECTDEQIDAFLQGMV